MSPFMINGGAKVDQFPEYQDKGMELNPLHSCYGTSDEKHIMILGLGNEPTVDGAVRKALGLPGHQTLHGEALGAAIRSTIASLSQEEATKKLRQFKVPVSDVVTLLDAVNSTENPLFQTADVWIDTPPGIDDLPRMISMPFSANCSTEHGPKRCAPDLGEHTKSFLAKGWAPRLCEAELPKKMSDTEKKIKQTKAEGSAPLQGITVVEMSHVGSVAAATTCMMADLGATVIKVELPQGDFWRKQDPRFFTQLNRGKKCVAMDYNKDAKGVINILKDAAILVTNLRIDELTALGLGADYKQRHKEIASLVVVQVTPFGPEGPQEQRGDLGAWWGSSGFASLLTGAPPAPPKVLPNQHGELSCSFNVMAGAMAGLFHARRTGEGQLIEVNLLNSGMWAMMQSVTMLLKDQSKIVLAQMKPEDFHNLYPVATVNSFRTSDGMWIQLLGVDIKRHLPIIVTALGIKWATYGKALWAVLTEVIPNFKGAPTFLERIQPVFFQLNGQLKRAIGQRTWAECKELFERHDVWHCTVNMPKDALGSEQARATNTFLGDPLAGPCLVATPVQLSACTHVPSTAMPELLQLEELNAACGW